MFACACVAIYWRCSGVTEKPCISGVVRSHNLLRISGVTESNVGTPSSGVRLLMLFSISLLRFELIIRLLRCKLHARYEFLRFWLIGAPNCRRPMAVTSQSWRTCKPLLCASILIINPMTAVYRIARLTSRSSLGAMLAA